LALRKLRAMHPRIIKPRLSFIFHPCRKY